MSQDKINEVTLNVILTEIPIKVGTSERAKAGKLENVTMTPEGNFNLRFKVDADNVQGLLLAGIKTNAVLVFIPEPATKKEG